MTPKAGRHKPPVVSTPTTPGTTTTVTTTTETSSLEEATTSNLRPLRHVEANVVRHGEPLTFSLGLAFSSVADPDPCLWLTDPDGDPWGPKNMRILRIRMLIRKTLVHLHQNSKERSDKEVKKTVEIEVFLNFFCLTMKGSLLVTKGSGCGSGSPTLFQNVT